MSQQFEYLASLLGILPAVIRSNPECDDSICESIQYSLEVSLNNFLSDRDRQLIVTHAAWELLASGQPSLAIRLISSSNPAWRDQASLVNVKLNALLMSGNLKAFDDELRLQSARGKSDQDIAHVVQTLLKRLDVQMAVRDPFWLLEHFWTHNHDDITVKIHDMMPDPTRWAAVNPALLSNIYDLREDLSLNRSEFDSRVQWGLAVFNYIVLLQTCHGKLQIGQAPIDLPSESVDRLNKLCGQIPNLLPLPDLRRLAEVKARGTPILLCCAHAGPESLALRFMYNLGIPTATVAGAATQATTNHVSIVSSASDTPQQFLRLIKMMKREQRVVLIFPDGPHGELRQLELFGRKVSVGAGASFIAHRTGASVFFPQSRWNGSSFVTELVEGPQAKAGVPREEYEAEFASFYITQLRDIILGQPECMMPKRGGGVWSHFS